MVRRKKGMPWPTAKMLLFLYKSNVKSIKISIRYKIVVWGRDVNSVDVVLCGPAETGLSEGSKQS